MQTVVEIAFAAAMFAVVVSFALVAARKASVRALAMVTVILAACTLAAVVVLGIDLVGDYADTEVLLLACAGLAAATLAEGALIPLVRGLERVRNADRASAEAVERLEAFLAEHERGRKTELERQLAHERANAGHLLTEQERRLAEERRELVARQVEAATAELTAAVAAAQERLERRVEAWVDDLERSQRGREARLSDAGKRQGDALADYDARLAATAESLAAVSAEQSAELARLRADFERRAAGALGGAEAEFEAYAAERRRALEELEQRLKERERSLRDRIEREEMEANVRLSAGWADSERRHVEAVGRAIERTVARLVEDAERRFDGQIKQSRDKSAERLGRELEKALEEFARRGEKEVADRIAQEAQATVDRLQRRIDDLAKAAEIGHEVSAERVRLASARLEEAVAVAERRILGLGSRVEEEVASRVAALEQAARTGRA